MSSSGFFDWRRRPESATARRRSRLAALIEKSFRDSDETYGYRRIHAELNRWGIACGLELVRGIMRDLGLQSCQPRPWRASLTEQDGHAHRIPDRVGRDFTAPAPGAKLVGDITYIPTWEGWLYLATVIDCHTKMVIGYAMDDNYKTPLISRAIRHAVPARFYTAGCDLSFRSRQQLHLDRVRRYAHPSRPTPIGRSHRHMLR